MEHERDHLRDQLREQHRLNIIRARVTATRILSAETLDLVRINCLILESLLCFQIK